VARSGARRRTTTAERPQRRREAARKPTRTEYSAVEGDLFFPKLRSQAKWVFVLLALAFAIGFVAFGVGSGGAGLDSLWSNNGGSSSGPSVGDARKKIDKGDLTAYKELADAYRNENKTDDAITAGEQYLKARPKDYEYMKTVAADYEGRASRQRDQATAIQDEVTASTGGATFGLVQTSKLGRAIGTGRIDQELQTSANQKLTELYSGMQGSYTRATQLYKQISAASPKDLLILQLLANAAYQSRDNQGAIDASRRVIKLAPGTQEARQAKQLIQLVKASAAAQPSG
jgi:tetratricopeptide (TPR) repeat protein